MAARRRSFAVCLLERLAHEGVGRRVRSFGSWPGPAAAGARGGDVGGAGLDDVFRRGTPFRRVTC